MFSRLSIFINDIIFPIFVCLTFSEPFACPFWRNFYMIASSVMILNELLSICSWALFRSVSLSTTTSLLPLPCNGMTKLLFLLNKLLFLQSFNAPRSAFDKVSLTLFFNVAANKSFSTNHKNVSSWWLFVLGGLHLEAFLIGGACFFFPDNDSLFKNKKRVLIRFLNKSYFFGILTNCSEVALEHMMRILKHLIKYYYSFPDL